MHPLVAVNDQSLVKCTVLRHDGGNIAPRDLVCRELRPGISPVVLLFDFSTSYTVQKAARINRLLSQIWKHVNEDEVLYQKLDYFVKKKGENDHARMTRFFKFIGPDDDTMAVLEKNLPGWLSNPESFWVRPRTTEWSAMSPRAEIVRSYIHTKRDDA